MHGGFGMPFGGKPKPEGALGSAGFVPGIARLGIPPLSGSQVAHLATGIAVMMSNAVGIICMSFIGPATPRPLALSIMALV